MRVKVRTQDPQLIFCMFGSSASIGDVVTIDAGIEVLFSRHVQPKSMLPGADVIIEFLITVASGCTAAVLANAIWRFVSSGNSGKQSRITSIEIERTEVLELTPDGIRRTIVETEKRTDKE